MQIRFGQRGFTLLELMIAIAILAIVGGAVFYSNSRVINQQLTLEEKTIAMWVLQNHVEMYRIQRKVRSAANLQPSGFSSMPTGTKQEWIGGRQFKIDITEVSALPVGNLQRLKLVLYKYEDLNNETPILELETLLDPS